ncbi:MAG: DUF72 domain-containing protein [Sedimentisphaerales bacterium]|nr:DUF72 domain-containing protein [Sedimentisphaerales bacterium]
MICPINIGIAGWSYPDWNGIVYTNSKADQLEFISNFVDCIEINSTFYRPPFEKTTKSWLERTSKHPEFFFTAKLHKRFTHEGRIDPEIVKYFHKGFEPLLQAGKLKSLLVQFRYDYSDTRGNRQHLSNIVKNFSDTFNLAVELRHKSWEKADAMGFLQELGVSVCNLDYPTTFNSFDMQQCTVGRAGYFRMHGRNAEKWFSKAGRDQTYNYYYDNKELSQIKSRLEKLAQAFETLTVIANNHYKGAELANALELKYLLTDQKQVVPEGLLRTYPKLAQISSNRQLF